MHPVHQQFSRKCTFFPGSLVRNSRGADTVMLAAANVVSSRDGEQATEVCKLTYIFINFSSPFFSDFNHPLTSLKGNLSDWAQLPLEPKHTLWNLFLTRAFALLPKLLHKISGRTWAFPQPKMFYVMKMSIMIVIPALSPPHTLLFVSWHVQ